MARAFVIAVVILIVIFAALAIFIVLDYMNSEKTKSELVEYGKSWALSKSELAEFNIHVQNEPEITIESTDYFIISYGDPSPIFTTLYFYPTKDMAESEYEYKKESIKQTLGEVIDERTYGNRFALFGIKEELGDENVLLWYQFGDMNILTAMAAEATDSTGNTKYVNLGLAINKLTDRIKENPFVH